MSVLAIDIGGTHVKILATGQKERREFQSGPKLTPKLMVVESRNSPRTGVMTWCL
jgi:polyphosphate glucokinase